jgi:CBS domain-containing protein
MSRRHLSLEEAGPTVADVMYVGPRVLAADAPATEAQAELDHPRTAVVLVVDGERFVGTITAADLPADDLDRPAGAFAKADAAVVAPEDPVETAFALREAEGLARIPVVDGAGALRGLVCFTRKGDAFCVAVPGGASTATA